MSKFRTKLEHAQAQRAGSVAVVLAVLAAQAASAQERIPAPALPCARVAGIVHAEGAAILSTGPYTYDRIVRDQGFCETESTAAPAFVPSVDNPQCFAGYRCRQTNRGENRAD